MKHRAPQHDLAGTENAFNLAGQIVPDSDRAAAAFRRESDRAAALLASEDPQDDPALDRHPQIDMFPDF